MATKRWDVFISHASEDKRDLVQPLAARLASFGAKVWYDAFTLELGDSLSRSIDTGLANSRFGLVVLSPPFFRKDWPEYELRGLVAKELGREKTILPIWHNVDREDVLSFSPPLADKLALKTSDHSLDEIALRVLGVVRPDLFSNLHARIAYERALAQGQKRTVNPKALRPGPIRHEQLPSDLVGRIRFIRAALLLPYPQTMELWLDGFKRDVQPEKDVAFWERVATCYLEYAAVTRLTRGQHKAAFGFIFEMFISGNESNTRDLAAQLPQDSLESLRDGCLSSMPVNEVCGPASVDEVFEMSEDEMNEWRNAYSPQDN